MKKIIIFLLALCVAMPAVAQNSKALEKALAKEYKTKMKEFKKGKWKLYGTGIPLDAALLLHSEKMRKEENYEIAGVCVGSNISKDEGMQTCINNAAIIYAQQAGRQLKVRTVSDMASDGVDPSSEFDRLYAAYESLVQKEISEELQPSLTLIKENTDGTFEMQSFFIVNESAATRARIRAYQHAEKEIAVDQELSRKIFDIVKEGFPPGIEY
jgi:hypothetical protein